MVWHHDAAASGPAADRARRRLLAYNQDDVLATAAIRRWLDTTTFPSLTDLDAPTTDRASKP